MPHGYKICKNCKELVSGARTKVCPHCDVFIGKEKPGEAVNEDGEVVRLVTRFPDGYIMPEGQINRIDSPAGPCPLTLNIEDDLTDWATEVRQELLNRNTYITNKGLAYWATAMLNKGLTLRPRGPEMTGIRQTIMGLPDIETRQVTV